MSGEYDDLLGESEEEGTSSDRAAESEASSTRSRSSSEVIKTADDAKRIVERIAKSGAAGEPDAPSARGRVKVDRGGDRTPAPDRSKIDLEWLMRRTGKKAKKKK